VLIYGLTVETIISGVISMIKKSGYLILLAALLLVLPLVYAQGAPEQIHDALADLSERIGRPLTLNDLFWRWEQRTFDDTSLGCPQEGQVYAQQVIVGYRFVFTFEDNNYDYRVSTDRSIVILCSVTPVDEDDARPTATPDADTPRYSNPLCPAPPAGISFMQTRLAAEMQARVTPGLPNNVRSGPSQTDPIIGEIPGGGIFTVVDGPHCDDNGLLWWQINFDGLLGWTAEGRDGDYFVEPIPGLALPAARDVIDADGLERLAEVSRLEGNIGGGLTFMPQAETAAGQTLIALGDRGSEGAWIYDLSAADVVPRLLPTTSALTGVSFSDDGPVVLFGGADGRIRLLDITPRAVIVERAVLLGHGTAISAVAFSTDGATVASSGGMAIVREERDDNRYAIVLWNVATVSQSAVLRGHTDSVTAMTATDDGLLYSASLDGTVQVWEINTAQPVALIEAPAAINAMALSPDATRIALALVSGDVVLVDTDGALQDTFSLHGGAATSVAFSPDGTLLASGGEDGEVFVWDISDDEAAPKLLAGHDDAIGAVAFSPDGTLIATSGADRSIRLWATVRTVG
jgi:hypothetical protein